MIPLIFAKFAKLKQTHICIMEAKFAMLVEPFFVEEFRAEKWTIVSIFLVNVVQNLKVGVYANFADFKNV